MLNKLSNFIEVDNDKKSLIDNLLSHEITYDDVRLKMKFEADYMCNYEYIDSPHTKFCPKCNRKYPEDENVCMECLVTLKNITDKTPVREIKTNPAFTFNGKNNYDSFQSILTDENLVRINEFKFTIKDYDNIIRTIKKTSLKNLDELIKDNYVDLNDLTVLEKILLFSKSFVKIGYKSYGPELGYFESDKIVIDDRQTDCLQTTTLIHELSHFLLKEILNGVLCKLLKCNKNNYIDVISTYILAYANFTRLIDEYSAHCCEGRFTVYGYQDYSSFLNIVKLMDGEMSKEEIEITKSIGNNFANTIKDILEIFIDADLIDDIKNDFKQYHYERPNYEMLKLENCNKLTDEGFLKAIKLIITEGFATAISNADKLDEYYKGGRNL